MCKFNKCRAYHPDSGLLYFFDTLAAKEEWCHGDGYREEGSNCSVEWEYFVGKDINEKDLYVNDMIVDELEVIGRILSDGEKGVSILRSDTTITVVPVADIDTYAFVETCKKEWGTEEKREVDDTVVPLTAWVCLKCSKQAAYEVVHIKKGNLSYSTIEYFCKSVRGHNVTEVIGQYNESRDQVIGPALKIIKRNMVAEIYKMEEILQDGMEVIVYRGGNCFAKGKILGFNNDIYKVKLHSDENNSDDELDVIYEGVENMVKEVGVDGDSIGQGIER